MHAEDDEKADSHEGEDDEKSLSIHKSAAKVSKIIYFQYNFAVLFLHVPLYSFRICI
jgi:hypothetical protein